MGRESTVVRGFPLAYASTQRFSLGSPRSFAIADDGNLVVYLRSVNGNTPTLCLWVFDLASGAERMLVDPSLLGRGGDEPTAEERVRRERAREAAAGIVRFAICAEQPRAVFVLAGEVFVTDLRSGQTRSVATATPAFDARLSPSGAHVAYTVGPDLRVVTLGSDAESDADRQLSPIEENANVSWGQAEFVAAEEMGRSRGFWWSPDSFQLLATRVDVEPVDQWYIGDPSDPRSVPARIRYPAAGTANAAVSLHGVSLHGEVGPPIPWAGPAGEDGLHQFEYLADLVWSNSGPLLVRQTRDQRTTSIVEVDIASATIAERRRISDAHWTELHSGSPTQYNGVLFTIEDLPDRRALCADGNPVTDPVVQVRSIVEVDEAGALITASTDSTEIHLFRIPADGWAPKQLSTEPGVHGAWASKGTMVTAATTPQSPVTTFDVRREPAPAYRLRNLSEDPHLRSEPIFLELGSRNLAAALFLPTDHDGTSALPVLLDPYGGPHAQRVLKHHNAHLVSRWFAEQGYAVLVTDGRGTPGRGPAFEREVWGDLAAPVLEDQIDALDAAAALYPFLDLDRVGIRGWSFGGYLAALAVLRASDRVHAAIAGAPVTDWLLYDTHYTERYLGHPHEHPEHYDRTNLVNDAAALDRPLLLIHGLADDNVVAAHTLQLSRALLAAGRSHQVLPLSGVTHMTPQAVVTQNLLILQRDFLDTHVRDRSMTPSFASATNRTGHGSG